MGLKVLTWRRGYHMRISYADMKKSVKKSIRKGDSKTYPDVILKDMKDYKIQLYLDNGKQGLGWRTVVRDDNSDVGFSFPENVRSQRGAVKLAKYKK
ncbi:hypothetical protein TrST_g12165 [Triparma strigata]|uniref:Uncharacterized protein n=1 Tax=Triparma strigata TaxID=1606541 RepID=A0A9W7EIG5_9STRA|nr:hypothetical protein TrST_g12165 [Triparma strigata]